MNRKWRKIEFEKEKDLCKRTNKKQNQQPKQYSRAKGLEEAEKVFNSSLTRLSIRSCVGQAAGSSTTASQYTTELSRSSIRSCVGQAVTSTTTASQYLTELTRDSQCTNSTQILERGIAQGARSTCTPTELVNASSTADLSKCCCEL